MDPKCKQALNTADHYKKFQYSKIASPKHDTKQRLQVIAK